MEKQNIIENLTKEEAIRLHREMWDFIHKGINENGVDIPTVRGDLKDEFLNSIGLEKYKVKNQCFLCEYSYQQCIRNLDTKNFCYYCPLDWCVGCDNKNNCKKIFCCECGKTNRLNWQFSDCETIRDLKEKE